MPIPQKQPLLFLPSSQTGLEGKEQMGVGMGLSGFFFSKSSDRRGHLVVLALLSCHARAGEHEHCRCARVETDLSNRLAAVRPFDRRPGSRVLLRFADLGSGTPGSTTGGSTAREPCMAPHRRSPALCRTSLSLSARPRLLLFSLPSGTNHPSARTDRSLAAFTRKR